MDKAELLVEELMNIWEQSENYTKDEVLDTLENIGELVKEYGHQLGQDTLDYIYNLRIESMICPECSEPLTYKSHKEESEAWGRTVLEDNGTLTCESCGFTYE